MRVRLFSVLSVLAATATMAVVPAVGQARVRAVRSHAATLTDHCIVKQAGKLTLTICYVT
jgi:hypothetical protein